MDQEEGGWRNRGLLLAGGGAAVLAAVAGAVYLMTRGKTGKGRKQYPTGEVYEGDLVNGKAEGYGVSTSPAGDVITGCFKNDVPRGKITAVYANGQTFEGEVLDDVNSRGTFRLPEGVEMEYEGRAGETLAGSVVVRIADGTVTFRGTFVDNLADGDSCFDIAKDGTYEGAMRRGQREGRGKLVGLGGNVYDGEWRKDCKWGQGTMSYADGTNYSGTWRDGEWVDGLLRKPDGRINTVLGGKIVK
jgi:hypothetical protein